MDLNTGNRKFQVTYTVGEHWSPITEVMTSLSKKVQPLYVTPGKDEIDIKTFKNISVTDDLLNFNFSDNKETGKGDLNTMFSGLEGIPAGPRSGRGS